MIAITTAGALTFLYAAPAGQLPSLPENATNADAAATTASDPLSATPQELARTQLTAGAASDGSVTPSEQVEASDGNVAPSEQVGAPDGDVMPSDEAEASDDQQSGGEASDAQPPPAVYVVNAGDTLTGIAHGLGSDVEAIADANGLDIDATIYVGQKLFIPAPATPGE